MNPGEGEAHGARTDVPLLNAHHVIAVDPGEPALALPGLGPAVSKSRAMILTT